MARTEIIGRPDAPDTEATTKIRIAQARRSAVSDLAVMRDRIAALKVMRTQAPEPAADTLREIRGTMHALLAELDR
jgi:hypothetical protein